jgi:hypothetical protein
MADHVPTFDELLADTAANIRRALEEAYDPTFPNWTAFVDVDDLAE